MTNLFSTFDPHSWSLLPLNWLSSLLVLSFLSPMFWVSKNQSFLILKTTMMSIFKEFKAISLPGSNPGMIGLTMALFMFISLNNFPGLFPYIFTSSSHMAFTIALALPLWLGHMVYASSITPTSMLAHLVPLGTPPILMPFMVLIELISNIIRPFTLSVRLAANMIAGHLLLSLMAGQASSLSMPILILLMFGLLLLCSLECAVSLIQAYVFSVLSSLYINEVNSAVLD